MKICTRCKQEKPLTEFNRQRIGTKDGLTYKCKQCAVAAARAALPAGLSIHPVVSWTEE